MALLLCTEHHAPATPTAYRAYARTARDLRCSVAGCRGRAVAWLDPEELHEYELGCRIFWERETLARVRIDHRPVERLEPSWRPPAPRPRRAWLSRLHYRSDRPR